MSENPDPDMHDPDMHDPDTHAMTQEVEDTGPAAKNTGSIPRERALF